MTGNKSKVKFMITFSKEKFLRYVKHDKKTIDTKPKDLKTSYKKRDEYYAKAYDAIVLEKKSFYWNWSAALFSPFWLLYRRMYIEAFLVIFIMTVLNWFFPSLFPLESSAYIIASLLFMAIVFVLFGLFGTPHYIHCIKKRVEAGKNIPASPVDLNIVLLVLVPPFLGYMVLGMLDVSPDTEAMFDFVDTLYFLTLALYKYIRASFDNIV